jgi:Uma2 family endonuclease
MNIHASLSRPQTNSTQAAEGLPRRAFTFDDVVLMVEAGIIGADERLELIGGELVPMAPKGLKHESFKMRLMRHFNRASPDSVEVISETTFRLDPSTTTEPDIVALPYGGLRLLSGLSALLVVEVADTSLAFDTSHKAQVYAAFGIREYWVIHTNGQTIAVHLEPSPLGYGRVTVHNADALVIPHLVPELALSLSKLDLDLA